MKIYILECKLIPQNSLPWNHTFYPSLLDADHYTCLSWIFPTYLFISTIRCFLSSFPSTFTWVETVFQNTPAQGKKIITMAIRHEDFSGSVPACSVESRVSQKFKNVFFWIFFWLLSSILAHWSDASYCPWPLKQ